MLGKILNEERMVLVDSVGVILEQENPKLSSIILLWSSGVDGALWFV